MRNDVIILHEYGANSHYKGLNNLKKVNLSYYEFSIIKHFVKSIIRFDKKLFFKQCKNIYMLFKLAFSKNKKIVLGMAPYDYRVYIISFILRNHKIYYHTSWSHWDQSFFPKKLFYSNLLVKKWNIFLKNQVTHIFSVTNFTKQSLIKNVNIPENKISVVYHSFEEDFFNNTKTTTFEENNIKFIFVGRLTESKGILKILDFFTQENKKNMTINFVGDGDLADKVKKASEKYENILFSGYVNDKKKLAKLYQKSNFLLLPSIKQKNWEEVFGMVMIEAMACGVVPIATNHIGPKEIIKDQTNGYIISENQFNSELNKILLNMTTSKYNNLQNEAIDFSYQFTLNNISKIWNKIND